MKNKLLIALCSIGMLTFGCSKSANPDLAVLQGAWSGQAMGGTSTGSLPSLVFNGSNLEFHGTDTNEWYKATFTLREDTQPKQLVVVITDCSFPQYVGKTAHAIFKIEGEKLTMAANEPGNPKTPASFGARGVREIEFTRK